MYNVAAGKAKTWAFKTFSSRVPLYNTKQVSVTLGSTIINSYSGYWVFRDSKPVVEFEVFKPYNQ
jgi:hypothetical protein